MKGNALGFIKAVSVAVSVVAVRSKLWGEKGSGTVLEVGSCEGACGGKLQRVEHDKGDPLGNSEVTGVRGKLGRSDCEDLGITF